MPDRPGLDLEVGEVVPGPKWTGIREALRRWDGWRDHDFVWMPDDDIAAPQAYVNRMFEVAAGVGLDLFAPALAEGSYFAHFIAIRNPRFFGRSTGFVEIMVPGFSRSALERLLPTLDESETGWGWGLDSVWPELLEYRNVGIIDGVPVTHTRLRPEELLARLADGQGTLIDQDPRVLAWLADFQLGRFGVPDYPTAGTPR